MSQCTFHYSNGVRCDQPALDTEGGRCLFHKSDIWRTRADEIKKGIEAKIKEQNYNFEGYNIPETSIFLEQEFKAPVNFRRAKFRAPIKFSKTKFYDIVDFRYAIFSKADFQEVQFSDADFQGAKFSEHANFHYSQFSGYANFDKVEFLNRANFEGVSFIGRASFQFTQFSSRTYFVRARFLDHTNFREAAFLDRVKFLSAQLSKIDFRNVRFLNYVDFRGTLFSDFTNFLGAKFLDKTHFHGARFLRHVNFRNTIFSEVKFDSAKFSIANFYRAHFMDNVNFNRVKFSIGNFENAIFSKNVNFNNTYGLDDKGERIICWRGNFIGTIFEKTTTFKDANIDPCFESTFLEHSGLKDIRWPEKKKLFDEKEADEMKNGIERMKRYRKALRSYFFIRTRLHAEGDFKDESDFLYREKRTEMKLLRTRLLFNPKHEEKDEVKGLAGERGTFGSFIEWLWLLITWLTCGFGEKILYIVGTFFFTWISFAFIIFSHVQINPQTIWECFFDALYISAGALSNLGFEYQDLTISLSRFALWIIQVEALIGIILISLFLVVFVRKMSRQ